MPAMLTHNSSFCLGTTFSTHTEYGSSLVECIYLQPLLLTNGVSHQYHLYESGTLCFFNIHLTLTVIIHHILTIHASVFSHNNFFVAYILSFCCDQGNKLLQLIRPRHISYYKSYQIKKSRPLIVNVTNHLCM